MLSGSDGTQEAETLPDLRRDGAGTARGRLRADHVMRGEVAPHRRAIRPKDHALAMLAACGVYSWGEIAAATGITAREIESKAQNVNFQVLVEEYRRRFQPLDRDELDVARENTDDAKNTLAFLRDVRDGKLDEVPHPKLSIRVAAARTLYGGQVAPRSAPPAERPLLPPLDTKRKLMLERILQDDMTEG